MAIGGTAIVRFVKEEKKIVACISSHFCKGFAPLKLHL